MNKLNPIKKHKDFFESTSDNSQKTKEDLKKKKNPDLQFIAYGILTVPVLAIITAGFTFSTISSGSLFVAAVCLTGAVHAISMIFANAFITIHLEEIPCAYPSLFLTKIDNKLSTHLKISTHSDLISKFERQDKPLTLIEKVKFCFMEFLQSHLNPLLLSMINDGAGFGVTYLCGLPIIYLLPSVIGPFLIVLRVSTLFYSIYKVIRSKLTEINESIEKKVVDIEENIKVDEVESEDEDEIEDEIEDIQNFEILKT
jgi:hypothetical protein